MTHKWVGLVTFLTMDPFYNLSITKVAEVPRFNYIYQRERASNMYKTSSYFFATYIVSTLNILIYPFIASAMAFYALDFEDKSSENYGRLLLSCWILS